MLSWAGICMADRNTKYYEGSKNLKRSNSKVTTKRNPGGLLTLLPGVVAKRILNFNNLFFARYIAYTRFISKRPFTTSNVFLVLRSS